MAVHTLRPGQCVVGEESDQFEVETANVALSNYDPAERKKGVALWRQAVRETCEEGKTAPPRRVLAEVFSMAGGMGDAEQSFAADCRDWRAVKAGEKSEKANALGKFEAEFGTRKDLHDQLKACLENQRTLRKLIKKVDSLQRTHSLTVHQGQAIRAANGRLFD